MKFIRDLIEQKSSEPAAPGQLADGNSEAPQPRAETAEKPFTASELYRIVEDDADDDVEAAFDAIDDADDIFGDDPIRAENDEDSAKPTSANAKPDTDPAANAATEDMVARLTRPVAQSDSALTPAKPVAPEKAVAPAAKPEPAPRPAAAPAAASRPVQASDAAEKPVTRPQRPVAPATASAAASTPKPAAATVSRPAPQTAPAPQPARPAQAAPESGPAAAKRPESDAPVSVDVPASSAGRGMGRAGRAKTRLLGFNTGMGKDSDPFARAAGSPEEAAYTQFPVGWLIVVEGPGRGAAFTLFNGVSQIGRGEGQTVRLDFGDNSISRENHAAIAYDAEQNSFFIGHGGKANLVRCNNMPVLSTQALSPGDTIRVGETSLRFVPLCCDDFHWADGRKDQGSHAANG